VPGIRGSNATERPKFNSAPTLSLRPPKGKGPDCSEALTATGVHPASNCYLHHCTRFLSKLRPFRLNGNAVMAKKQTGRGRKQDRTLCSARVPLGERRRYEPITQHRFLHLCRIRRTGRQQTRNVLEVLRTEHSRAERAEACRGLFRPVREPVHNAAFDEDGFAGRHINILALCVPKT
jgi:hypothetical protein